MSLKSFFIDFSQMKHYTIIAEIVKEFCMDGLQGGSGGGDN